MELEYDPAKEKSNLRKHGVDFSTIAEVFADQFRIILPNAAHSTDDEKNSMPSAMTAGAS